MKLVNDVRHLRLPVQNRLVAEPGMLVVVAYPASMNAKLGSVLFVRSVKYCDNGAMWLGSMQNEFVESPTTLEGCVVPVHAASCSSFW